MKICEIYILFNKTILEFILLFLFLVSNFYDIFDSKEFYEILPHTKNVNNKSKKLKDIFIARKLFINKSNLTVKYIQYVRNKIKWNYKNYTNNSINNNMKFYADYFPIRKDQFNLTQYIKLCMEEKLIYSEKIKPSKYPLISIIVSTYNKKDIIKKSIRSIQNQSLKNIEIIIVDDCSTENNTEVYNELIIYSFRKYGCLEIKDKWIFIFQGKICNSI